MDDVQHVAHFLLRHGLVVATAESCTAGLIAAKLAEVPGCGSCLRLAVVTYAPEAKTGVLDVSQDLIDRHGLTSEAVSLAMARGVLAMSGADLAVANTGVADDGADDGTPVGTQCFAWIFRAASRAGQPVEFAETRRFGGDRNTIRDAAAEWALTRIPHYLTLARAQHG
ncbi:CinA family protein [Cupriavidus pauculus]|uniref:CinA family protein n=1 Tax=Cupriavidus pauculus TaxID=82633 RepID=UPI000784FEC9|nr:nicotinamide-nucleotide amidohydrolase family protein [Cupriavidus pauculus]MBY4730414.1 nicotinamide-nucleotide amidohydrolase family protein [Cupriavidus pauculus]